MPKRAQARTHARTRAHMHTCTLGWVGGWVSVGGGGGLGGAAGAGGEGVGAGAGGLRPGGWAGWAGWVGECGWGSGGGCLGRAGKRFQSETNPVAHHPFRPTAAFPCPWDPGRRFLRFSYHHERTMGLI